MRFLIFVLITWLTKASAQGPIDCVNDQTVVLADGYDLEVYCIKTSDGYILKLFRMRGSLRSPKADNKPVVFLEHGLMLTANDWIILGPEKGFAYLLADAGFDVWLGNSRGNSYSKAHVSLKPEFPKFWNFVWYEIGTIDVPACIDFILAETGKQKIQYIGHSQGTTALFVMLSERIEYNDKLHSAHAFAPVAFMDHMKSPIKALAPIGALASYLIDITGYFDFIAEDHILIILIREFCFLNDMTTTFCKEVIFSIVGEDREQFTNEMFKSFLKGYPAGASIKQGFHYMREIVSKRFQTYDGSYDFHLENINATIILHYSDNDLFVAVEDVERLFNGLTNSKDKEMIRVPLDKFNHGDFIWAKDAMIHPKGATPHSGHFVCGPSSVIEIS